MKIQFDFTGASFSKADACLFAGHSRKGTLELGAIQDKDLMSEIKSLKSYELFEAKKDQILTTEVAGMIHLVSLGTKKTYKLSDLRKTGAKVLKALKASHAKSVAIDIDSFIIADDFEGSLAHLLEGILLADYGFDKYKSKKSELKLKKLILCSADKKLKTKASKVLAHVQGQTESVKFARDLVNEAPNILNSENYAKLLEKDAKANLAGVKVKILNKAQIKKQKMNLFLSVNAGSAHEPRLVHLTYTPKKMKKSAKHYALVGKGITFDTGGYSLKPSTAMVSMKFDMGGSSTLYGAFRAAVLAEVPHKVSCILPMTDNAVNALATTPDSVIVGRNGKSVEILNTDAEGRLILADALDYACDLKPDAVIDAATLTGACLVALGSEVCAVLGNDQKLVDKLLSSAKDQDEYMWQLPIIEEWRADMKKSNIADLRNIGTSRFAGTATAAAFLENFIKDDIPWAHLDIAGVCDSQSHLPYCPAKGGSGVMIRTIVDFLSK